MMSFEIGNYLYKRNVKMTKRLLISTIILTLLLANCNDPNDPQTRISLSFDSPFPKRNKNLWWKLGDQFSFKKNNDTITYRLAFNSENRKNHIINNKTNDTIFAGTISKYRGLYFFDYQINDTTYWISAVDIDKNIFNDYNTMRGMGTVLQQMQLLYERIDQGEFKKLIKHKISENNIRLKPDKKLLLDFYSSIIDSFPPDTLVDLQTIEGKAEKVPDTTDQTNINETTVDFDEYEIIKKVYPNPTQDYCNIETYQADQYHFDLVDNTGKLVHRGQLTSSTEKIDLTDIQTGMYVLRIYTVDKKNIETIKIIKKKIKTCGNSGHRQWRLTGLNSPVFPIFIFRFRWTVSTFKIRHCPCPRTVTPPQPQFPFPSYSSSSYPAT